MNRWPNYFLDIHVIIKWSVVVGNSLCDIGLGFNGQCPEGCKNPWKFRFLIDKTRLLYIQTMSRIPIPFLELLMIHCSIDVAFIRRTWSGFSYIWRMHVCIFSLYNRIHKCCSLTIGIYQVCNFINLYSYFVGVQNSEYRFNTSYMWY